MTRLTLRILVRIATSFAAVCIVAWPLRAQQSVEADKALLATERGAGDPLFLFGIAMGTFITWTHRSNLARLRAGTENRFEQAMLFRRRGGG